MTVRTPQNACVTLSSSTRKRPRGKSTSIPITSAGAVARIAVLLGSPRGGVRSIASGSSNVSYGNVVSGPCTPGGQPWRTSRVTPS